MERHLKEFFRIGTRLILIRLNLNNIAENINRGDAIKQKGLRNNRFRGKENDEMFRGFVRPLFRVYTDEMDKGNNYITYDALLVLYFYGSPYSDPADAIIAATYAMIAAEALGLGSCMIGGIHPLIQNGRKAKNFREKHRIKCKSKEGIFIIIGEPDVKYRKGIKRTFASIERR